MAWVARGAWLLAPFALVALPTRWLASAPNVCVFRQVTGRPCPGCGMTRALSRLAHGDLRGAWRDNRRVVIVAPLLLAVWARTLAEVIARVRQTAAKPLSRRSGGGVGGGRGATPLALALGR